MFNKKLFLCIVSPLFIQAADIQDALENFKNHAYNNQSCFLGKESISPASTITQVACRYQFAPSTFLDLWDNGSLLFALANLEMLHARVPMQDFYNQKIINQRIHAYTILLGLLHRYDPNEYPYHLSKIDKERLCCHVFNPPQDLKVLCKHAYAPKHPLLDENNISLIDGNPANLANLRQKMADRKDFTHALAIKAALFDKRYAVQEPEHFVGVYISQTDNQRTYVALDSLNDMFPTELRYSEKRPWLVEKQPSALAQFIKDTIETDSLES